MKFLLAEDDVNLGLLLQEYLIAKGYPTDLATNGNDALDKFMQNQYDFCILDVMMPKKDGFTVAKEIRLINEQIPIIFLTAKALKEDRWQGFKAGADDYLTKPFDMEELLLRIKAILRRVGTLPPVAKVTTYQLGNYTFDATTQQLVYPNETPITLTAKEAALMQLFCEHPNQLISRSYALKLVWGNDSYFNARSMDVYMTKLRKHLRHDPNLKIVNMHGEGFKLLTNN